MFLKYSVETVTTHTMTTKLFGAYDDVDIEDLLTQLTPEELEDISNQVDPDDRLLPANQRCRDQTKKLPTGPLNRRQLLDYIERTSMEQEDWPEPVPFQSGMKRGTAWIPKGIPMPKNDDEDIAIDLDDEYERALDGAEEDDLVDLAAILGLHSMMSQDQFYSSTSKRIAGIGTRFESVVKAYQPRSLPFEPPNPTNVEKTIEQVRNNDANLKTLNLNNIKNISSETFSRLFEGLNSNTQLQNLSLANTGMTDTPSRSLCEALSNNKGLKIVNVESNYITPLGIKDLMESLLETEVVEEFRAANQRPEVKGVKTEMDIATLVEKNKSLLRLGMHFDIPTARMRVHHHLQQNNDNVRVRRVNK